MFGNMEEKQEEMRQRLSEMELTAEAGGVVTVKANALRQILDLKISPDFQYQDIEELEDLVINAVNRVLQQAAELEQSEAQKMLNDMLPPGLGNLGDLFGGGGL